MEHIVSYQVFINKYAPDHQTINEAISNYRQINGLKVDLISKLTKKKHSKKIVKIEKLFKEEVQYFEWIKVQLLQYPGSNKDVAMNSDIDSSDSSLYSNDANMYSFKGGNNQNAMHFDVTNVNNYDYHNNHSVEGSDDAKNDKILLKRRKDPPPAPPAPSAMPQQSVYNLSYSYTESDDDDDGVSPKNLKINAPKDNKMDRCYYNHGKKGKNNITEPCTPSSEDSDGEQEEKYHFKLPANNNLEFIQSMDTTPPPNAAYIPEPGAVGIAAHNLMIIICEVLMQSYPLPVHQQVMEKELAIKYNYNAKRNEINKILKDCDCVSLHNDGYYYISPKQLEQTLLTNQVNERQKIIKNKLKFLMEHIHKDGMTMNGKNISSFFEHFIGWIPSKQDVELMRILLSQSTKQFRDDYGVRPLRDVLSFKEMLICSLHSFDYNGCSKDELGSALRYRFRITLDLNNPFIKEVLDEISDPNVVKARGNYKLGFKTKQVNRGLLQWWSAQYEPVNCKRNPTYNEYKKYYTDYHGGNMHNNGGDSFGCKQFKYEHNNMGQSNNWHYGNSHNGEEYG